MKTQFNGDDIRQLLALSDTERQIVIAFVDACENNSPLPTPPQDAPEVLNRMYTREVKRRKSSARRKSKAEVAKKPHNTEEKNKLRETIDRQSRFIAYLQQSLDHFRKRFRDISSLPSSCNKTPQERHRAIRFKLKKLCIMTEDLFAQTLGSRQYPQYSKQ